MTGSANAQGATPLDPDEATGLIPRHITTQGDLNTWEEANIVVGERWAFRQRRRDVLTEAFVREVHKKMFDQTWRWAGRFRTTDKNIGVDWTQISVRLRNLLENTRYQIEHQVFAPDELALRFHHQLVWIHAFANGNGRHARLLADVMATRLGQPRFTWGGGAQFLSGTRTRDHYLESLRAADAGHLALLLQFARA